MVLKLGIIQLVAECKYYILICIGILHVYNDNIDNCIHPSMDENLRLNESRIELEIFHE